MSAPFILVLVLAALWALRRMARMGPSEVRAFQRQLLGYGLCGFAAFLLLRGNLFLGLPALGIGAGLLGYSHLLPDGFNARGGQGAGQQRQSPPQNPSTGMDRNEALNVLGLRPGATTDEIKAAHKRLQRSNHPDAGGSDYLSGKINQARDVLLGN